MLKTTARINTIKLLLTAASLQIVISSGCSRAGIGIKPETPRTVDPSSPIVINDSASELKGKPLKDILVLANVTVQDVPMTSRLIHKVADEASNGVLSIYTKTETAYTIKLLPGRSEGRRFTIPGEALGSAFIIHSKGYALTNNHVIENASKITARTKSGEDLNVEIVARDPVLDLALLKVISTNTDFQPIPMGNSEETAVGDIVIAVGNPLGLGHTVTQGIISQTSRNLKAVTQRSPGRYPEFIQTDTAINPGSSGGPLITLSGAWIGVNTAQIQGAEGISFSVPSSQVKTFLETVLKSDN